MIKPNSDENVPSASSAKSSAALTERAEPVVADTATGEAGASGVMGPGSWVSSDLFLSVVKRLETPLLRYLGNILPREEAEDIAQEAFVKLYIATLREEIYKPDAFVFRVAHNMAVDVIRKRHREKTAQQRLVREAEIHAKEAEADGLAKLIRQAATERALEELNNLPEVKRRILLLKIVHEFTFRDIAQITGRSAGAVAHHMNSGLTELTRKLKAAGVI